MTQSTRQKFYNRFLVRGISSLSQEPQQLITRVFLLLLFVLIVTTSLDIWIIISHKINS